MQFLVLLVVTFSWDIATGASDQVSPGDVINTVSQSEIDNALDDVLSHSKKDQLAGIGIVCLAKGLTNPEFVTKEGRLHSTLPKDIEVGMTGMVLFEKSALMNGLYGVVSYDIEGIDFKVVILFSVPWDRLLDDNNKFNIKIMPRSVPVDKSLINHMHDRAGSWKAKGYSKRTEYGIEMEGTMTNSEKSKMIVWVDATGFNLTLGPSRYADCDFRAAALGDRCWRECTPTGWCWTKVKCNDASDCNGDMHCIATCS